MEENTDTPENTDNTTNPPIHEEAKKALASTPKNNSKMRTIRRVVTTLILIALTVVAFIFYQANKENAPSDRSSQGKEVTKVAEKDDAPKSVDKTSASFEIKSILEKGKATPVTLKDDAVRVDIFFDPMCPYCAMAHNEVKDDLHNMLLNGEVELHLTPVSFLDEMSSDNYSTRAINAFIEISENSPEHSLAFLDAIFAENFQPEEKDAYKPISTDDLVKVAQKIGVSKDVTDKFKKMNFESWIKSSAEAQMNRTDIFERFSTPAFFAGLSYEEGSTVSPERMQFTEKDKIANVFQSSILRVKKSAE